MTPHKRQLSGEDVGRVHLCGLDAHDHATFCGHCWAGEEYEETDDPVDCAGCLRTVAEATALLHRESRAQRRSRRAGKVS